MAEKSLLIVGGGMAGLAAGCYAQMNGYRSEILEAGRVAGGLCSAWTRKGYTFDTSIHFLSGWKTGALRGVWEELGAVQGREFIVHEEAGRIEAQGKTLVVHRDLDRSEEHLLSFSSADAARIHELIDLARRCTTLDMPVGRPPELLGPIGLARMLFQIRPFLSIWRKYSKLSIQTFAAGFRDPFLREAVRLLGDGTAWPMPDRPLASVAMQLAWEHTGNAGAP
ncbi:MAG: NAD(P)-binding protein, partial [Candidatus Bipolaricaulota bacterium]|nr:NAD(P)-binding protein [Candidatus Bipolaricaulota bacterium]